MLQVDVELEPGAMVIEQDPPLALNVMPVTQALVCDVLTLVPDGRLGEGALTEAMVTSLEEWFVMVVVLDTPPPSPERARLVGLAVKAAPGVTALEKAAGPVPLLFIATTVNV
jgi:hypothetical protein